MMSTTIRLKVLHRRNFVLGAGGMAAIAALTLAGPALAQDAAQLDAILKKLLGDAKPAEGKINLDLPEIAENGNTVPFTVTVDSPMTATDSVKMLTILAPGNPQPDVASFNFTPLSGKASVASRMRLGRTQDVYAVAQMADGKAFLTKRTVKVTIGGCGG